MTAPFLVVHQPGPTSFVLKHGETHRKFKVFLGDPHRCSCGGKGEENVCLHVLFVLAKVFRIPTDNPMLWQHSLIEAEIDQLTKSRSALHHVNMQQAALGSKAGIPSRVTRREPTAEEDCPICCDSVDPLRRQLVHCRFGCGNNIHTSCFMQYAAHNTSARSDGPLLCPLCRCNWGPIAGTGDAAASVHHQARCEACFCLVAGNLYRCSFCACYHLCEPCFRAAAAHTQHPFNVCECPGEPWRLAERPSPSTNRPGYGEAVARSLTDRGDADADPRLAALLRRELRPEDYELLLELDRHVPRPRGEQLTAEEAARLERSDWLGGGSDDEPTVCPICLDALQTRDVVVHLRPCGHAFHEACAVHWLTTGRAVCPVDNAAIALPPEVRRGEQSFPAANEGSAAAAVRRRSGSSGAVHHRVARHRFEASRVAQPATHQIHSTGGSYVPNTVDLGALVVGGRGALAPPCPAPPVSVTVDRPTVGGRLQLVTRPPTLRSVSQGTGPSPDGLAVGPASMAAPSGDARTAVVPGTVGRTGPHRGRLAQPAAARPPAPFSGQPRGSLPPAFAFSVVGTHRDSASL